jgi:PAS domain S-box-containing protein
MLVAEFASLIERSDKIIMVLDAVGTVLAQNEPIRELGYEPVDMLGTHVLQYVHPDDYLRVMKGAVNFFSQVGLGTPIEFRFTCPDGSYKPVRVTGFNMARGGRGRVGAFLEFEVLSDGESGEEASVDESSSASACVIPFEPLSTESAEAKRRTAMAKLTTVLDDFSSDEIESLYEELISLK